MDVGKSKHRGVTPRSWRTDNGKHDLLNNFGTLGVHSIGINPWRAVPRGLPENGRGGGPKSKIVENMVFPTDGNKLGVNPATSVKPMSPFRQKSQGKLTFLAVL